MRLDFWNWKREREDREYEERRRKDWERCATRERLYQEYWVTLDVLRHPVESYLCPLCHGQDYKMLFFNYEGSTLASRYWGEYSGTLLESAKRPSLLVECSRCKCVKLYRVLKEDA